MYKSQIKKEQKAFQIDIRDNVATALNALITGKVSLCGDVAQKAVSALGEVPRGHKIAVKHINAEEDIIKYGVRIGRASQDIRKGEWVHLHNIRSVYDERSSHLDVHTGAPKDTTYE